MKFIDKIGFFRLTLLPIGLLIICSAIFNGILGMGIVGVIILIFGLLNQCLLMGKCEIDDKNIKSTQKNKRD